MFSLLRLPLELREQIYAHYFDPASCLEPDEGGGGGRYLFDFALYRVSKQLYLEAQTVFRRENVFVRIETPWPTAVLVQHISTEGGVPLVAAAQPAIAFRLHQATIRITAPEHAALASHIIILHLRDLRLFARVWYYSSLSYPELNAHLAATFVLDTPYYGADPQPVPISLQKKLLLDFVNVKGLYAVEVEGFDEGVRAQLDRGMRVPHKSVRACCEEAASISEEGDAALAEGRAEDALGFYTKAFRAIHIIINGRTRRVLADSFFHQSIEGGRFSGQTGMTVRIILRIRLVSRTISAYLKLLQWAEAAFWGMRSIRIMRESMASEFEDFLSEFVGGEDVGMIYLRTAVAFEKMERDQSKELEEFAEDDTGNSGQLYHLAARYLKGRDKKELRKELEGHGVNVPAVFNVELESQEDRDSMTHMGLEEHGAMESP